MDQLPRLGMRELICLLLLRCYYVVSVWRGFLFRWVLGIGYVFLLWHSLSLPYNYFVSLPDHLDSLQKVLHSVQEVPVPKEILVLETIWIHYGFLWLLLLWMLYQQDFALSLRISTGMVLYAPLSVELCWQRRRESALLH